MSVPSVIVKKLNLMYTSCHIDVSTPCHARLKRLFLAFSVSWHIYACSVAVILPFHLI